MNPPGDRLRPLVARLAERLATADGNTILRQLQWLFHDLDADPKAPAPAPRPAAQPGAEVAIWEAKDGPGGREFVRNPKYYHAWRAAAEMERIPPKSARKRIVFLGESAARGLYYDPAYTPAQVLQAALDTAGAGCEVIDLAITAIRPLQLMGLIRQLPALQPDAIVLFAGNNWHWEFDREPSGAEEAGALAAALARGVESYRAEVERRIIGGVAERVIATLEATARTLGAAVVVVVPEFNLADWRDQVPPPLADGPPLPVPTGGSEPTRARLEAARDSLGGLPYWSCPRCLSSTQAMLRATARRFGARVVDLPQLFGETIPGRALFLDYCHMTAHGIRLAMGAVAAEVAGIFAGRSGPVAAAGAAGLPEPAGRVAAAAHLLAAVHNAILGQPAEVIAHHCREGMKRDPQAGELLRALLRARASEVPDWLDGELALACSLPNSRRHMIRAILPSEGRHFPYALMEFAGPGFGREIAPRMGDRRIDLLDTRFKRASLHLDRAASREAKTRRTEFDFLRPEAAALRIKACLRTPCGADPGGKVRISLGAAQLWQGPIGAGWKNLELAAKAGGEPGSVQTLSVEWPECADPSRVRKGAQDSVDRGEPPDIYPTFGEIQSLILQW